MNQDLLIYTFKHIPTLESDRLILRPMRVDDVQDMYDYAKRSDLTKYLLWSAHQSQAYTKEYLKYVVKRYKAGAFYDWAVVEKSSGRMIGTCGFTSIDIEHRRAEIGYVINPDFQRNGYAPEAARIVLEYGFSVLELHRIEARFMKDNEASLKVMRAVGMSFEGYLRDSMLVKGEYRTIGVCSILKDEYNVVLKKIHINNVTTE